MSGTVQEFPPASICRKCAGQCCKNLPGIASPGDFGHSRNEIEARLTEALRSGRWAVDWWEGKLPRQRPTDDRTPYFVRPAVKGYEGRLRHGAWGGECTFLTPQGCSLEHSQRPLQCRALEPKTDGKCVLHCGDKGAMAREWLPYNDVIVSAVRLAEGDTPGQHEG